jgi:sialate O-acetylesterase
MYLRNDGRLESRPHRQAGKPALLGVALIWALCSLTASAVTLPRIFGDNMVLQRERPLPLWGWAAPGEKVTVQFAGQEKSATADSQGRWQVRLKASPASAVPADLTIIGANRIVLTNILVGDVWFCSGQSNMEKPIGEQRGQKPTKNYQEELASGDLYPNIRLFKVEKVLAPTPTNDVKGAWNVCSSNALEQTKFSAVAYFYGREIHKELNIPIGLVESSWGGTRIEPWTPPAGFQAVSKLADFAKPATGTNKLVNTTPSAIYNGMVAPVVPFAIRGALWYQGESNCMDQHDAAIYTDKMEALIKGWRAVWNQGDFPFYYVQLAPFHYYYEIAKPRVLVPDALPLIWEAQTDALRIHNTGMVVITDLVDNLKDIHPTQKVEVGRRLALVALAKEYGRKSFVCSGPTFNKMKIRNGKAVLSFDNLGGGLAGKDGQPLTWFTIAGADSKFVSADAAIEGNTVVVSSAAVPEPKAVRFAWHEAAQPNLFNRAGLPAVPFRTDKPRPAARQFATDNLASSK